jgi:hypothetical protein
MNKTLAIVLKLKYLDLILIRVHSNLKAELENLKSFLISNKFILRFY